VCVRGDKTEVKCVLKDQTMQISPRKISQQRATAASLPGCKHAKTPLKHVERATAFDQTTVLEYCPPPFKSFHPPLAVNASSPYQRPPCPPVYTTARFLSIPGLVCSTHTTPPSLPITPPHRQTRSLQAGSSQATGEHVRLQARYVSSSHQQQEKDSLSQLQWQWH